MVVDNEKDALTVMVKALEAHGLNVVGYTDPNLALQHFADGGNSFDAIVSNVRMQGLTGFQLARKVKELHPQIKIVLMSSFELTRREFDKVMPSTSVDSFICKPFAISKLVQVIESLD
jgi:DNA-binding NtrC family response regulator